jgi:DNA polymerase-3 subunit delta
MAITGAEQLKKDLKSRNIGQLYLIYGEESYLKQHYLEMLQKKVVDETFADFNLHILEGEKMTAQALQDAVESYPAMAERKMVIVKDFDPLKANSEWRDMLTQLVSDLPEYVCLVFYFETLAFKPDKRVKLYSVFHKVGCFAEFSRLDSRELVTWLQRHAKAEGKYLDTETGEYMLYLCGNSMVNLLTELAKVTAYCVTDTIERKHIDAVCVKTLDAVVFDLTDAIGAGAFSKAFQISRELIAQKNEPVMLLSMVSKHIQRLYGVRLTAPLGQDAVMESLNNRSGFYVKKMTRTAQSFSLGWLRDAMLLCGETDTLLKSTGVEKEKTWELFLLKLAEMQHDSNQRSHSGRR